VRDAFKFWLLEDSWDVSLCPSGLCKLAVTELLVVVCIGVAEGEDRHDHLHVMYPIVEVVERYVAHSEVAVDAETSEVTVLARRTASIQAKIVWEVLLIVIPHETTAG